MKNRPILFVMLTVLAASIVTGQALTVNLVQNGSFETPNIDPNNTVPVPSPWYKNSGAGNAGLVIYDAAGQGLFNSLPYGDQVLYLYGENYDYVSAAQDLGTIDMNADYTVSVKVSAFLGEDWAGYAVDLGVVGLGGIKRVGTPWGTAPDIVNGNWTTVTFTTDHTLYEPGYAGGTLVLKLGAWSNSIGVPGPERKAACFDDVIVDGPEIPPTGPGILTGTVTLQDFAVNKCPMAVRIELIKNSVVVRTEEPILLANGAYTITNVDPDTYDVAFKAGPFLRTIVTTVVVPPGTTVTVPTVSLVNGDLDGDNAVTTTDLSAVLSNLN